MSGATDADRERAFTVADALSEVIDDMSGIYPAGVEIIAVALAEEREKARAPFLALAEELERHAGLMRAQEGSGGPLDVVLRSQSFADAAANIRRAAEADA